MVSKKWILSALATALVVESFQSQAHNIDKLQKEGKEKCVGVAKAGENDCSALDGSHICAGLSTKDKDPNEWKFVPTGTCKKLGGKIYQPKKKLAS